MKVTVEHLPRREVVLEIEAESPEVEHARQAAYRKLVQRARIPGFRQGKAPLSMLERYLGKSTLLEETINHLIPEVTSEALKAQSIEAAGTPNIQISSVEPVRWKATVPLTPTVDLKDYKSLRIETPPVEVKPEEVDKVLEDLRFQQAPWQPVQRTAEPGDLLTLDIHGEEGGKTVVEQKGVEYRAVAGSPFPVPGFTEAVLGLKPGDEKEFSLTVPDADERVEYRGKTFHFKVNVSDVKTKQLPTLDDEFAKGVGDGYDSLTALRTYLHNQLLEGAQQRVKEELKEQAIQKVVDGSAVEFSPHLVDHEVEHMIEEEARRQNQKSLEQYLSSVGKSQEEAVAELRPRAEERIRRSLILTDLKEKEGIQVSPEEIQGELDTLVASSASQSGELQRIFGSETGLKSIERSLLTRKTLDRLVDIVTAKERAPNGEAKEATTDAKSV